MNVQVVSQPPRVLVLAFLRPSIILGIKDDARRLSMAIGAHKLAETARLANGSEKRAEQGGSRRQAANGRGRDGQASLNAVLRGIGAPIPLLSNAFHQLDSLNTANYKNEGGNVALRNQSSLFGFQSTSIALITVRRGAV